MQICSGGEKRGKKAELHRPTIIIAKHLLYNWSSCYL